MTLVCLPLHVWDREIDSRILLTVLLADLGATVVFGHEQNISPLYSSVPNIFHYGCGRPIDDGVRSSQWYRPIIDNGGFVGLTYEEGINDMLHKDNALWAFNGINSHSIDSLSKFYSWSSLDQSHVIEACPPSLRAALSSKTSCSSNPRLEMLGSLGRNYFERQVDSLTSLFGSFVLVSDNFGIEAFGTKAPADVGPGYAKAAGKQFIEQMRTYWGDWFRESIAIRDRFVQVVDYIARVNPDLNFIVRPHPVSDPRFWYNALAPRRNLFVFYKDTIFPWIFSSKCVIHSGCTVGFEARLAGVSSINISHLIHDTRRKSLSSYCSTSSPKSIEQLSKSLVDSIKASPVSKSPSSCSLDDNMSSLDRSVFEAVHSLGINLPQTSSLKEICSDFIDFRHNISRDRRTSHSTSVDLIRSILPLLGKNPPNPGKSRLFSFAEIVDKFRRASSSLPHASPVVVAKTPSPNVFIAYRKS